MADSNMFTGAIGQFHVALPEGVSQEEYEKIKSNITQWKFGSPAGHGELLPLERFSEESPKKYSLFSSESACFLHWEKMNFGINLGWTDDGGAETGVKNARWHFRRDGENDSPIKYGEFLALGYGTPPSYYRYKVRDVGMNVENVGDPAYEWRIFGGAKGAPVKLGDPVGIHNSNVDDGQGDFMVRHERTVGGSIGWVTSPESDLIKKFVTKENIITAAKFAAALI
jgi:hypothetical protein